MITVDFKITTWERVLIPDHLKDELLEKMSSGDITTSNELIEAIEESNFQGILEETSQQKAPEFNNGEPTINIIDADGVELWDNIAW